MKAVTCTNAKLEVVEQPTPTPAKGQLLIDVLRCGICGSDLHARNHCDELAEVLNETGYPDFMRSTQSVVFGHEFCGKVIDHGPKTRKAPKAGTPVVALPLLRRGKDVHTVGLSAKAPGCCFRLRLSRKWGLSDTFKSLAGWDSASSRVTASSRFDPARRLRVAAAAASRVVCDRCGR